MIILSSERVENMNLKELFTMAKSKDARKVCFKSSEDDCYILSNLTNTKSGLILFKIDNWDYIKISDDIRKIRKYIDERGLLVK